MSVLQSFTLLSADVSSTSPVSKNRTLTTVALHALALEERHTLKEDVICRVCKRLMQMNRGHLNFLSEFNTVIMLWSGLLLCVRTLTQ
jgi:hypothetical protein